MARCRNFVREKAILDELREAGFRFGYLNSNCTDAFLCGT